MDTTTAPNTDHGRARLQLIEQVLSLSELCEHLHVSAQTIYDLRSRGRGPEGFRVGRELRFRISEILAGAALSVATCTVVTALGFRLADIRRSVVGGVYAALLAVAYAVALTTMYGASTTTWAVWPAIAAQLAVVYAI